MAQSGGSTGIAVLNLFDTNHDGSISTAEVENSALIHSLFAPDVDLFDATGAFHPLTDNVKDSVSVGFGFTCVPATF
jgi:hypothetical protein